MFRERLGRESIRWERLRECVDRVELRAVRERFVGRRHGERRFFGRSHGERQLVERG
jgi:hypothetical protein